MLYSFKKGWIDFLNFNLVEVSGVKYYYSGLIYMLDYVAGRETVIHLNDIYAKTGEVPFIDLFGSFSLIIEKTDGELLFFTDNSNMHCFFLTKDSISDRILPIIKEDKLVDLDEKALCEFLDVGSVYFGKTLAKGVSLSASDIYYQVINKEIHCIDKNIGNIESRSRIKDPNLFFDKMAFSLSNERITLSLTGGYDSRQVFACLNRGLKIDTFISGDNEKAEDIIISKKVAYMGNADHKQIKTKKPIISEEFLYSTFFLADGILPCISDGNFRIDNFKNEIRKDKYTLYLTGDGGVLHKDWWWMQDLPFYNKKSTDLNKFYSQRISYIDQSRYYTLDFQEKVTESKLNFIENIKGYTKNTNTQSYDSFYFYLNGKKMPLSYTKSNYNFSMYAPLWELELVRYSYALPRIKRFFYNSMREITTKANKNIARIPTGYGTTSSSEVRYIFRDVFYQIIDYYRKVVRLLGRKLFGKTLYVGSPVTWDCEKEIKGSKLAESALQFAINRKYLNSETTIEMIPYDLLGRIIQVHMIQQYMNGELDKISEGKIMQFRDLKNNIPY